MTSLEMLNALKVGYDSMYSLSAPGFEDPAYSIILTKAQKVLIRSILTSKNNKNQEGLEETEVRNQGLSALVKDGTDNVAANFPTLSPDQAGSFPTESFWDLPPDFMYTLNEGVTTSVENCSTETFDRITVLPISHDEYYQNFYNPYKKPWTNGSEGLVWRISYSRGTNGRKRHGLITDGNFTITNYHLRYLKNPVNIVVDEQTPANNVDCELDESTHEAIVGIAINLLARAVREQLPPEQLPIEILE